MYLLAGLLTVLWAFVIFFLLPPDPIRAKGFSAREKYVAVARVRVNNSGVRNTHWKLNQVIEALTDLKFWIMFFILFFSSIPNGCFSTVSSAPFPSLYICETSLTNLLVRTDDANHYQQ